MPAVRDKAFDNLVKHFSTCAQYKIDQPTLALIPMHKEKLIKLRAAKMSWFGQTENAVRAAVDKFIREN